MIDNVIDGPVSLVPGDNPKIDERAWQAYTMLIDLPIDAQRCRCAGERPYCICRIMLMGYEPSGTFGRLVAQFKSRDTRQYRRVSFGYSCADPVTRRPAWEVERDYIACCAHCATVESMGINGSGLYESALDLHDRAERLTGRILPGPAAVIARAKAVR